MNEIILIQPPNCDLTMLRKCSKSNCKPPFALKRNTACLVVHTNNIKLNYWMIWQGIFLPNKSQCQPLWRWRCAGPQPPCVRVFVHCVLGQDISNGIHGSRMQGATRRVYRIYNSSLKKNAVSPRREGDVRCQITRRLWQRELAAWHTV